MKQHEKDELALAELRKEAGYGLAMDFEEMTKEYARHKKLHNRLGADAADPWFWSSENQRLFLVRFKGSKKVEAVIAAESNEELFDIIDQWTSPYECEVKLVGSGGVWLSDVEFSEEEAEWSGLSEEWCMGAADRHSWRPAHMHASLEMFERMLPLLARMERRSVRGMSRFLDTIEEKLSEDRQTARQATGTVGQDGARRREQRGGKNPHRVRSRHPRLQEGRNRSRSPEPAGDPNGTARERKADQRR